MSHGFVDLQVNGFLGVDFSSPDLIEADFVRACRALLAQGTAAFLPTVITSSLDTYARNLPLMAAVMAREEFRGRLIIRAGILTDEVERCNAEIGKAISRGLPEIAGYWRTYLDEVNEELDEIRNSLQKSA